MKYSKAYFIFTTILFLIIPIKMMPEAVERLKMIVFVFIFYIAFYFFIEIGLINNKAFKNYSLIKKNKIINFQLHLFLFFMFAAFIVSLILALSDYANITLYLLFTNIFLSLMNCIFKNKRNYLIS
jgi:hypothetical protein